MISFRICGHSNLLATHRNTLEFTKDKDLTKKGDCIVGVKADFDTMEVKKFAREYSEAKLKLKIKDYVFESAFLLNRDFSDGHEIVIRRSEFASGRTLGIRADKVAVDIPREMVRPLQDPNTEGTVELYGIK